MLRYRRLMLPAATVLVAACTMAGEGLFRGAEGDGSGAVRPAWEGRDLSGGWAAGRVLGTEVRGLDGGEIGRVEDIVIGPDDRVQAVAVRIAGASSDAGRRILVPWRDLRATPSRESFAIPVTVGAVGSYPDAGPEPAGASPDGSGKRAWHATELIGDRVELDDASDYGRVEDLLFDADGTARGVVVAPSSAGARGAARAYALPFRGFGPGFPPEAPVYGLPYGRQDVAGAEPFDYDVF